MSGSLRRGTMEIALIAETRRAEENLKRVAGTVGTVERKISTASTAMQRSSGAFDVIAKKAGGAAGGLKSFKGQVEPTATAISGLSSAMGGLGGTTGAVVGAVSNLASVMMSGGPLGIGITALTFGAGVLVSKLYEQKEAAEAAAKANKEALAKSYETVKQSAKDAEFAVKTFGKTAAEVALAQTRMQIAEQKRIEASAKNTIRARRVAMRVMGVREGISPQELSSRLDAAKGGTLGFDAEDVAVFRMINTQAEQAQETLKGTSTIMGELRKQEKANLQLVKLTKGEEEKRKAIAGEKHKQKASFIGLLEKELMLLQKGTKVAGYRRELTKEEFENMIGRREGPSRVQIGSSDLGGQLAQRRMLEGRTEVSREEFLNPELSADELARQSLERKRAADSFGMAILQAVQNPSIMGKVGGMMAAGIGAAAGPVGGAIAGGIANFLTGLVDELFAAGEALQQEAIRAAGTILSGSERGAGLMSAGQTAMGSASAVGGAAGALMFSTGPIGAALSPLTSAAVGATAGLGSLGLELVSMTESFQRSSGAFDVALDPMVEALEPLGAEFVKLAPIVGIVGQAMGEMSALGGEQGGMTALFNAAKLSGGVLIRMGQGALVVATAFQHLNMVTAGLVSAHATMTEWIVQSGHKLGLFTDEQKLAAEIAAKDSMEMATAAGGMGEDLGELGEALGAAAIHLATMSEDQAFAFGEKMAAEAEAAAEGLADLNRETQTSTRNLPTFFKAGAAAHQSADAEDGSAPGGQQHGGVYVGQMIILSDEVSDPETLVSRIEEIALQETGAGSTMPVVAMHNQFNR